MTDRATAWGMERVPTPARALNLASGVVKTTRGASVGGKCGEQPAWSLLNKGGRHGNCGVMESSPRNVREGGGLDYTRWRAAIMNHRAMSDGEL